MLGAYHIENCRANYPRLVNVIDAAVAAIGPALADVKLGHQSRHGFRALFKYDGAKDYVEDMLKAVATMRPKLALEPWPMNQTPPQFSCVVRGAKDRYPFLDIDPWQYCKLGPLAAFYAPGTSFIFLCPRFFNTPDIPTDLTRRSCPGVQDNRWTYNERNLYDYQTYIIIHEMIHFYLQHQTLSGTTWPPEQYGIDGCVALSPLNSLHNPTSYQVYVASKLNLSCTDIECISKVLSQWSNMAAHRLLILTGLRTGCRATRSRSCLA